MGILTNLFTTYQNYKDFQQRQQKGKLDNVMSGIQAGQELGLYPDGKITDQNQLSQLAGAGVPVPKAEGQPQQQEVSPFKKLLGMGGDQKPQYQSVGVPSTPMYTVDPTGKIQQGPSIPKGAAVERLAQPKTVEYINPQTKESYDIPYNQKPPEGAIRADIYKQDRSDDRTAANQRAIAERAAASQEEMAKRQDKSIEAVTKRLEGKPDTANEDKQRRIAIETKKALGESIPIADAAWAKSYDKVTAKTGEPVAFADRPPEEQDDIQTKAAAMVEGRMAVPPAYLRARDKTGVWNEALKLAMESDPTFNESTYSTRAKVRQSFTSGKDKANVTSLNTAIGHIATLKEKISKLNNFGWFTYANSVKNLYKTKVSGAPAVKEFNEAATAVNNELATAFKGTTGTDQEVKEWRKGLDASDSPAQLNGVADTAIELLGSRIEKLREAYDVGMGTTTDFQVIRGNARKTLIDLIGKEKVDAMDPPAQKKEAGASDEKFSRKSGDKPPLSKEEALKAGKALGLPGF